MDPDYKVYRLVKEVFDSSKKTYGYRRIADEIRDCKGIIINYKKVLRIMRKYGIQAQYIRNIKPNYSKKCIEENIKDDLLKRKFNQRGWVTDITYLIFGSKRAYLSTILDLKTRKVVSHIISSRNDNKLVMDTLNLAISKTKDLNGLIIHSDQGSPYVSTEYRIICESNGILISMSRRGTPLDNAVIESFHSILKKETLYNNDIKNLKEYIQLVEEWIEFYNTTRRKQKK
ncbi:transposase [Mariniplasma anaerobium]|uniref:Transposase n=1 Tax=Mariniplasma anaerobium TaxID=2735436 RepID=A0A7U9TID4_9MOLU|nr:transposase [Mariniplasma anaerobium]